VFVEFLDQQPRQLQRQRVGQDLAKLRQKVRAQAFRGARLAIRIKLRRVE
jgi:hypothetical protein